MALYFFSFALTGKTVLRPFGSKRQGRAISSKMRRGFALLGNVLFL